MVSSCLCVSVRFSQVTFNPVNLVGTAYNIIFVPFSALLLIVPELFYDNTYIHNTNMESVQNFEVKPGELNVVGMYTS